MKNIDILVGLQFGDEGKGKVSHFLSPNYDVSVRFNGGPNAGHTIKSDNKKVVLHHLPAISLKRSRGMDTNIAILGPGVLINPFVLNEEIKKIEDFTEEESNIYIDNKCFVIENEHILQDQITGGKVGTTGNGIGPCIADQIHRKGKRIEDVKDKLNLEADICFIDTANIIRENIEIENRILLEGAQGFELDILHGDYPYVTSSHCNPNIVYTTIPTIKHHHIDKVYGVFKAYLTRVGNGNFPTEITDKGLNDYIVRRGGEFGSTTGRQRRVGWLNLDQLKVACSYCNITDLVLTKADVLNELPEVFIQIEDEMISFPGWQNMGDNNFKNFYRLIETYLDLPITILSFGPETNQTITL